MQININKKIIFILSLFFLMYHCSFDNKSGIWRGNDVIKKPIVLNKDDDGNLKKSDPNLEISKKFKLKCALKKDKEEYYQCMTGKNYKWESQSYKEVFKKSKPFNESVIYKKINKINLANQKEIFSWNNLYQNNTNNLGNIKYLSINKDSYNSVNLKTKVNEPHLLFYEGKIILNDNKGVIIKYSLSEKKKQIIYNFYKDNKKVKKLNKKLFMLIEGENLYVADNLGYFYKINLSKNKLIWAKNYLVPFRSEIKFYKTNIYLLNEKNVIYSIDSNSGNINWKYKTQNSNLNTKFINSLTLKNDNLFVLNTTGEIYSINLKSRNINWVNNVNSYSNSGKSLISFPNPLVVNDSFLIYSSNEELRILDLNFGSMYSNLFTNISIKPIVSNDIIYFVTQKNLIVCYDIEKRSVIWSKRINEMTNIKKNKKIGNILKILLINNDLYIFTDKGYLLAASKSGDIISYSKKSKSGLKTIPIIVAEKMFFLDKKSKLIIF